MSELGQQLREARLQKGLSLDDVQDMTKIRKRYLEAIEAGDYKVLPGTFYVRAFIKTYAETVGLNADELLEGHKKDVPVQEQEATMEPVIQKRASRASGEQNMKWLSNALMWLFPILIIVVIYVYITSRGNEDNNPPGGIAQNNNQTQTPPATGGGQGTGNEETAPPANTGQNNTPPATTQDQPGTTDGQIGGGGSTTDEQGETSQENSGTEESGTEEPGTDEGTGTTEGVTVTQDGKAGKTTIFNVSSASGDPVKVEIQASGESWLEVYRGENSTGEKLQYGMTTAGDTKSFDLDERGMYIKSGASSATAIKVGGQPVSDGKATTRIRLVQVKAADNTAGTNSDTSKTEMDSNGE
ncbi:helix-turn-helix domain-containing protein [Paenibacillus sp. P96]|uniref:Helix-turn-helix domain-containing protein n=1 Tax=Paenibacillus zeirhizosphaerae TaxID=2987519 RepID=A0ABT9FRW4_9BACL|nr:RodZ family helix-turn-helix domain-containing protein [Paenibacillus sp. P96]MDP4097474.1 helix-turn-helix domain-containing protein [Paenibacillus sp. P96]